MKSWRIFDRKKILERGKTMDYKDTEITLTNTHGQARGGAVEIL